MNQIRLIIKVKNTNNLNLSRPFRVIDLKIEQNPQIP